MKKVMHGVHDRFFIFTHTYYFYSQAMLLRLIIYYDCLFYLTIPCKRRNRRNNKSPWFHPSLLKDISSVSDINIGGIAYGVRSSIRT